MSVSQSNTRRALLALLNFSALCEDDQDLEWKSVQPIISIVVCSFFGAICVLSVIGNSLVIFAITMNASMRTNSTYLLIGNLAIADLFFALFCIPFTAMDYVLPYWIFGDVWCRIVEYLITVTACASIYTIVLMSLDRYLIVVHPVKSIPFRTTTGVNIAIVIMWLLILGSCVPVLIINGEFIDTDWPCNTIPTSGPVCGIIMYWTVFQLTFFIASYVVPVLLISVFYILMLKRLWNINNPTCTDTSNRRQRRRKITKLIGIIFAVFAMCWLPIQLVLVLKSLGMFELTKVTIGLQIACHIIAYMNSCLNPIMYAFLNEKFCEEFRKITYRRSRE